MTSSIYDDSDFLHVYGQNQQHDEIYIVGTKNGLLKLKQAIENALKNKQAKTETCAGDGEGFCLKIISVEQKNILDNLILPYSSDLYNVKHKTGPWQLWRK